MGCGCNKARAAVSPAATIQRVTVYQVINGTDVVAEFGSLPEARKKAVEVAGRVKVTTKTVK